jgi:hypothetical protein
VICNNCAEAGRANADANLAANDSAGDNELLIAELYSRATNLHGQCINVGKVAPNGGPDTTWCDCHHRIGPGHINTDADGNPVRSA